MRYLLLSGDNDPEGFQDEFRDYDHPNLSLEELGLSADLKADVRKWQSDYENYLHLEASIDVKNPEVRKSFADLDRQGFVLIGKVINEVPGTKAKYFSCGFSRQFYDVRELEKFLQRPI